MIVNDAELPIEPLAPRRGLHWSRGRLAIGFYKVGPSWVALLKAPRFGMIHWSHWSAWRVIWTFPMAFFVHLRFAISRWR